MELKMKATIAFLNPKGVGMGSMFCLGPAKAAFAASADKKLSKLARLKFEFIDANAHSQKALEELLAKTKPLFACVTLYEKCIESVVGLLLLLRKTSPHTKQIICGPYPSFFPIEALRITGADVLLRGECEKTLPQFLRAAFDQNADKGSLDEIPGLYMAKNGKNYLFKKSSELPLLSQKELDNLKPNWEIVKKFEKNNCSSVRILLTSSRGCNGRCVFCGRSYNRKFRAETPKATADKVEAALEAFPEKKMVEFNDDSFLEDKTRVLKLAKIFLKRGLSKKASYSIQARVDSFFLRPDGGKRLDGELLLAIALLNVKEIYLGVESFSQRELRRLGKGNYSKEDVFALYNALENAGVESIISYIILSNADTQPEDLLETLQGMEELYKKHKKTLGVDLSPFLLAFSQTPERRILEKKGDLKVIDCVAEMPKNEIVRKTLQATSSLLNRLKIEKQDWADIQRRKIYEISALWKTKKNLLKILG